MSSTRAFILLLCSYLVSCQSPRSLLIENYGEAKKLVPQYVRQYSENQKSISWVGPPPAPAIRRHRANPASPALLGHVDLVLEDGQAVGQPAAIVMVAKQLLTTDAAGNYALALTPGQYALRSGGVGLLWSQAPPLHVAAGDSVRLDFRLLQDRRPLID